MGNLESEGNLGRRRLGIGLILGLMLAPVPVVMAQDVAPSRDAAQEAALARAKELFRQGVVLFQAGSTDSALELFLQSREAFSSSKNTMNAAICLERLERFDEALEMYEQVLRLHDDELDEENRASVQTTIRRLSAKVGTLRVSSNVSGSLVVDGRLRGAVPMRAPLRLVPGRHVIRVLADGHATFETDVQVRAGDTGTVDAKLERLVRSGGLRVEDPSAPGTQVMVDGAVVGETPWEGTLAPGPHLVQTRSAELGSAPARAMVVERQTVLVRLASRPLGPRYVFEVTPRTAALAVDGVALGDGRWDGFLPAGSYTVTAGEEGYVSQSQTMVVPAGRHGTKIVMLRLRVDPDHPRWPKPPKGHLWAGAFGGWGMGGGLRSGPERTCPGGCSADPPATGFVVGARAGFELPALVSVELNAGFLSLWRSIDREFETSFTHEGSTWPVTYSLEDKVRLQGPFVGAGASQRVPLTERWSLVGRTTIGAWFTKSTDTVTGRVGEETLSIANAGKSVSSTALVVMPELGAQWALEPWTLSAGLAALFVPMEGPTLPHGGMVASPDACTSANPGAPSCAPESEAIGNERAYGPFWMLLPQVSVSHRF